MTKGTDYTIEKKEEVRRISKIGEPVTMYRIWATSKGGTYFHVEVPENELDRANDYLTNRAKQLDAI